MIGARTQLSIENVLYVIPEAPAQRNPEPHILEITDKPINFSQKPMDISGSESSPKLIVLGEANVGKTSILDQWLHHNFCRETPPTIGAGLSTVDLQVNGNAQTFNIWDTAGTPQFRSVVPMYCRQAAIAVIVFDLTALGTFEKVEAWHEFVRETAEPVFLLVGNKLDLRDDRDVEFDVAKELAAKLECQYVEMSASTREGIEDFESAVNECARQSMAKMVVRTAQTVRPQLSNEKCC
jgi:small GTP-binding protein